MFVGDYPDNVKFYNCTIVSNSSTSTAKNIRIWQSAPSSGPQFFNTIVWGSANSINYRGLGPDPTDFNYCAIQGYISGYTNCINLNSTNNNPLGPNFYNVTAGSEDYRINFISPCRDIGTSSGAPSLDYLGNSRIGNFDIGAYEVQYSRWTGASSDLWATPSNWVANVDPASGTGDVIIPSGLSVYPIGSASQDFTIGAGKIMILNPGAKATFNSLTNSGTLKMESDATGISSLIFNNTGIAATVDLYLPGKELLAVNNWHYISSPVSSLPVSIFTATTLDLAQYVEGLPNGDNEGLVEGWIAFDGYSYVLGKIPVPPLYTFNNLSVGRGYNYYYKFNHKYTFSGTLNASDVAVSLEYSGIPTLNGFNLLGNPFSSGLNWDDIVNSVYYPYPASTSKGLYFTRDNVQCSYIAGVGIPTDVSGIIPPMQGFFTKTYSTGNTITLPAAARTNLSIHSRYKGTSIIPLIRLSVTENQISDETVVRFDDLAKLSLDYDFDLIKMFYPESGPSIYSDLDGIKYSINGLPFPETIIEIPIGVSFPISGEHTISTTQLQGMDDYFVTLTDNVTGYTADLKTTPNIVFTSSAGSVTDRFILKVRNLTTGTEDPLVTKYLFVIYPANNMINIKPGSDVWDGKSGSVKILDLTGKTVRDLNNAEFRLNSVLEVSAPVVKGIYIIEIKSGPLKYVGKVVIK